MQIQKMIVSINFSTENINLYDYCLLQVDLKNTIAKALNARLNGVVLWANHKLAKDEVTCYQLKYYVNNVLGPFVLKLLNQRKSPPPCHLS